MKFSGKVIRYKPVRTPSQVRLVPGRVYRTRDLARWGANPTRLAASLVGSGRLTRLAPGLYLAPLKTRFGAAPPTADALLQALLSGDSYVVTGPERWNALGLGATALSPARWVYNRKRTGDFELGGQRLHLRRVAFPNRPTAEWLVIDLLENLQFAGVDAAVVESRLAAALADGRFDLEALREMAERYGTQRTRDRLERVATRAAA
jgi:hypothetical protein